MTATIKTILYWAIWMGLIYMGAKAGPWLVMVIEIKSADGAAWICTIIGAFFGIMGFIVISWVNEKINGVLNL